MKNSKKSISIIATAVLLTYGCASVKTNLTFKNYIKTDITVNVESYSRKGDLKVNESFIVGKSISDQNSNTPTDRIFVTKGYKGGNIKIKYNPTESNTKFTLDPIIVPNSEDELNQAIPLTGLVLYDVNDNKQRLISLGTDLKFDSTTDFSRLLDIKQQLGSLVIGKKESDKLQILDIIPLKDIDITYEKTSTLQESTVTEKSVVSQLKLSIPIYGSIESMMSNSDLHQVKWDISYYPFFSNVGFSNLITDLDQASKKSLINKLKLNDQNLDIFILRSFNVIESGIFSVTSGTKINTEGNAAIASVFTANAAYAFKSEDSKFVSIPNKSYNIKYEKWQSVSELITKLEGLIALPPDGKTSPTIMIPFINIK